MVNSELAERLAVELDLGLGQCIDELRVTDTLGTGGCVQTNRPESTEVLLLALAVAVRVLSGLDDGFLSFLDGRTAHALVALGELVKSFDSAMPVDTAFNSHEK